MHNNIQCRNTIKIWKHQNEIHFPVKFHDINLQKESGYTTHNQWASDLCRFTDATCNKPQEKISLWPDKTCPCLHCTKSDTLSNHCELIKLTKIILGQTMHVWEISIRSSHSWFTYILCNKYIIKFRSLINCDPRIRPCACVSYSLSWECRRKMIDCYTINPCCTEFIFMTQRYLYFLSYLNTEMAQVVETFPWGRQRLVYPAQSIMWFLMTWWYPEPEHQQPRYWLSYPGIVQFRDQKGKTPRQLIIIDRWLVSSWDKFIAI